VSDRSSRWQTIGLVLAGLALFAGSLVITAPARWVGVLLSRSTQGQWQLRDTAGSVWRGSGTLSMNAVGAEAFATRLTWSIQPWWLLAGKIRAELSSPDPGDLHVGVAVGYHSLQLSDAEAKLPATLITALAPTASLFAPTGTLHFSTHDLTLNSQGLAGELQLRWLGAGGRLAGVGELGDYLLVATGQPDGVALRGETLRGEVRLDLHGQWQLTGDGTLTLDGSVAASGPRETALAPLLTMLNARREGDRQVFRYSSPLARPAWVGGKS